MSVPDTHSPDSLDLALATPPPFLEHVPAPASRRGWWPLAAVGAAVVVVVVVAAVAGATVLSPDGPTLADAQRECKTAFAREFQARMERADAGTSPVIASMTGVDLDESREVDGGFEVNGAVRYDLTASLVGTVSDTLMFTCTAEVTKDGLATTVRNRT